MKNSYTSLAWCLWLERTADLTKFLKKCGIVVLTLCRIKWVNISYSIHPGDICYWLAVSQKHAYFRVSILDEWTFRSDKSEKDSTPWYHSYVDSKIAKLIETE